MTYVLVHGGGFDSACWDLLVEHLDAPALAVDLPRRGSRPAALGSLRLSDSVDAVCDDIVSRDLDDVILVGHSMAGITLPGVAERIPERLRHLVFIACTVPADGQSSIDTLDPEIRAAAEENIFRNRESGGRLDAATATALFCNDMDDQQIAYTLERMVPEAVQITAEPVSLAGLHNEIARTWIRTELDAIVSPEKQTRFARHVDAAIHSIDAAHMAMISQPARLAALLSTVI